MAVSANRLELLQIADAVAREKSIDRGIVIAAMEDAIAKAARSRYGAETDVHAEIEPKTGELRHTVTGFAERVVALAFSNDSKLLACGGGAPTQEGELKLIDVAAGKVVREIKDNVHSDTVFGVHFSPDDKTLVSGGADKFVKTFDVASG